MGNVLPETTIDYKKNGYQKCRHLTGIHQGIGPREIRGQTLTHMHQVLKELSVLSLRSEM